MGSERWRQHRDQAIVAIKSEETSSRLRNRRPNNCLDSSRECAPRLEETAMMKRLWMLAAVMFLTTIPALAQEYPRVELFGGYSALVAGDLNNLDHANGFGAE